jgi:hypothetical protein
MAVEGGEACHDWKGRCLEMSAWPTETIQVRDIPPPLRQQQYPLLTSCGLWQAFLCRFCFPPALPADSGTGPSCAATRRAKQRLSPVVCVRLHSVSSLHTSPKGSCAHILRCYSSTSRTLGLGVKLHVSLASGYNFTHPLASGLSFTYFWSQGTTSRILSLGVQLYVSLVSGYNFTYLWSRGITSRILGLGGTTSRIHGLRVQLHVSLVSGYNFTYPWSRGTTPRIRGLRATVGTRPPLQTQPNSNYTLCFLLLMTVWRFCVPSLFKENKDELSSWGLLSLERRVTSGQHGMHFINPQVHHRDHKSLLHFLILSQIRSIWLILGYQACLISAQKKEALWVSETFVGNCVILCS